MNYIVFDKSGKRNTKHLTSPDPTQRDRPSHEVIPFGTWQGGEKGAAIAIAKTFCPPYKGGRGPMPFIGTQGVLSFTKKMRDVFFALSHKKWLTVLALLLFSSAAFAQWEQGPMRGPAAERVEQFKKLRLMEVLNLDEETSIRFFARYNKHMETMRQIRKRQMELLQQIQALRKSDAEDVEYGKVLQEMRSLEEKSTEAKLKYFDELGGVLTKKQLAEYIAFEVRFQQNLREILREIQKKREEQMMKH